MDAKLAKEEVVLKSWDYSKAGHRFDRHKVQKTLTVTNKRIIASEEGDFVLNRNEIPLSAVKSIKCSYRKNDSLWTKIKFVIACIACVVVVGFFFVFKLRQQLKSCIFEMQIQTKGVEGMPLAIGAIPDTGVAKRFQLFSKGINKMKIYCDKNIAKDIVNEIGALALDNA